MAKAVQVIYTIQDDKGKQATTAVKIPSTLTLPEMVEFSQQMAILINNLTTGQIVNVGVCVAVDISGLGLATAPGATSDVEEKGYFQFNTAGAFKSSVQVPCFSDLLVVGGSDRIDESDASVVAFRDAMLTGITLPVATTTVQPCDAREDDIVSLAFARERFRSSGKRA